MKASLASIQSLIAPVTVPVAPAVLLGNEIYTVMRSAEVVWLLALFGAITAAVGLEFTGGATCYAAVRAASRREWGAFVVASAGAVIYMGMVGGAMLILPDKRAQVFVVFAILTPVAYIAYGLIQDIRDRDKATDRKLNYDLEIMRQKRLLTNAEARKAKAEAEGVRSERSPVRSGGEHPNTPDSPHQAAAYAYLDQHGQVSIRELAGAIEAEVGSCSTSTAKKWLDEWLKEN